MALIYIILQDETTLSQSLFQKKKIVMVENDMESEGCMHMGH